MKDELEKLKKQFTRLKIEQVDYEHHFEQNIEIVQYIHLSGMNGNSNVVLSTKNKGDIEKLLALPLEEIVFFKEFLGIYYDKKVEVMLFDFGARVDFFSEKILDKRALDVKLSFKNQELKIKIQKSEEETYFKNLARLIKAGGYKNHPLTTLTIEGFHNIQFENFGAARLNHDKI